MVILPKPIALKLSLVSCKYLGVAAYSSIAIKSKNDAGFMSHVIKEKNKYENYLTKRDYTITPISINLKFTLKQAVG